jgi:hypothetical protein
MFIMGYVLPQSFAAGPDFLGHRQWPAVFGVQDLDSSPRTFHRAGG